MTLLEKNSTLVITDSGGVQKESHFFSKPSIVLRAETEWVELVSNGTVILADADQKKILKAYQRLSRGDDLSYPGFYGDGKAASFIMREIVEMVG
ncbi:MAG: UDP-N-acetylglucosamine 2-epimerase [Bacteroidales bacterium]